MKKPAAKGKGEETMAFLGGVEPALIQKFTQFT
jgi:hypothetical protein